MSGLELNVTVEGAFARVGSEVLTCYEGWKKWSLFNGWEGFSVAFCRRYKGSSYLFLLVMAMLRAVAYHMSAHEDLAAFLGSCTCGQLTLRLTPGFLFPQLAYVKVSTFN
jgi:hypothetical protein